MFSEWKIIGMLECGRTQNEESQILNVPVCVISRLWQGFEVREMLPIDQYQVDQE